MTGRVWYIATTRPLRQTGCGLTISPMCALPAGFCCTAFITDAFSRKIICWLTRTTMRIDALPLEALEHALFSTKDEALDGLSHHSNRGFPYVNPLLRPHCPSRASRQPNGSRATLRITQATEVKAAVMRHCNADRWSERR